MSVTVWPVKRWPDSTLISLIWGGEDGVSQAASSTSAKDKLNSRIVLWRYVNIVSPLEQIAALGCGTGFKDLDVQAVVGL